MFYPDRLVGKKNMSHIDEPTFHPNMTEAPSMVSFQQQGSVGMTLENAALWRTFNTIGTEMIITKQGRRMFPHCSVSLSGLEPNVKYIIMVDIVPMNCYRYKWNKEQWEIADEAGAEPPHRLYQPLDTSTLGKHLMRHPLSFYKLKLTNHVSDDNGHIILQSMHLYYPRFHVVQADSPHTADSVHTFAFPETVFMAVTTYMNEKIIKLKIDHNPFAKGFRERKVPVKRKRQSVIINKEVTPKKKDLSSPSPGLQMMPSTFEPVEGENPVSTQQSEGHPAAWSDATHIHNVIQQYQDYNYNNEELAVPSSPPAQPYRFQENTDGPQNNFHPPHSTDEYGAQQNGLNFSLEWNQFTYYLDYWSSRMLMS